ncbi:amidohydrolase family protein [Streptomyces sp. NPDC051956]|uniref:amidohydrolase family protein n=1 Tax=Streptomyces sp. NPDC051956 TaxID=3365677 RepID=UPI0037D87938
MAYDQALALHTTQAARPLGEDHLRGAVTPGRLADLTIWDQDPAHCPSDTPRRPQPRPHLRGRRPRHTCRGAVTAAVRGLRGSSLPPF